jgi:HSP20 family protein
MSFWDGFNEFDALEREFGRAFGGGRFPSRSSFSPISFLPGRRARAYPLMNLTEDKDSYYVECLAPGVEPKSLNITVAHNVLTVSGEKPGLNGGVKPEAYHRNERAAGKFVRTLSLPEEVDEEKIVADYKNGLLLIALPKAELAKPKQIAVRVD